jgi:integrase
MSSYVRHPKFRELFKKPGSSVWWAFLPREGAGRMPRASTGQRDDKAAHQWYLDRVRSPAGQASKDETTLSEALKRRHAERRAAGRAAGTLDCIEKKGRQLLRVLGKDTPLSRVDARTVDEYVSTRLAELTYADDSPRPGARSTIYKELVTLRGAMKLARRQEYACRAVEEVMPLDFSPEYKPKERALGLNEIESLLRALPVKRAAIVAFVLATGATYPSELVSLRKGDVDVTKWMVRLRGTKRATRDRKVPIVNFAREWVTQAMPYLPFEKWGNVRRDMHLACDTAGIARCSPNDLRRSMGTLLRAKGVEPSLIGTYLGHKDSRMVLRVYGRLAPEQLAHLLSKSLGEKKPRRTKAA